MTVAAAVPLWHANVEPAKSKYRFRLGSPAMTNAPTGKAWLTDFMSKVNASQIDFVVVHWYGSDFAQLQSFLKDMHTTFNKPLWLNEFAYSHQGQQPAPTAADVQAFMKQAIPFLDGCDYVERYAYFGAPTNVGDFVGSASNFSNGGQSLTDVGKLYLTM